MVVTPDFWKITLDTASPYNTVRRMLSKITKHLSSQNLDVKALRSAAENLKFRLLDRYDEDFLDAFPEEWKPFLSHIASQDGRDVDAAINAAHATALTMPPLYVATSDSAPVVQAPPPTVTVNTPNTAITDKAAAAVRASKKVFGPAISRRFEAMCVTDFLVEQRGLKPTEVQTVFRDITPNWQAVAHSDELSGITAGVVSSSEAPQEQDSLLFMKSFLSAPILCNNVGSLRAAKEVFKAQAAYADVDPNSFCGQMLFLQRTDLFEDAQKALKKQYGEAGSPNYPDLPGNSKPYKQWKATDTLPLPKTLDELVSLLRDRSIPAWTYQQADTQRLACYSGPSAASLKPSAHGQQKDLNQSQKEGKEQIAQQPFRGSSPVAEPGHGKAAVAQDANSAGSKQRNADNRQASSYRPSQPSPCRQCDFLGYKDERHWKDDCPRTEQYHKAKLQEGQGASDNATSKQ